MKRTISFGRELPGESPKDHYTSKRGFCTAQKRPVGRKIPNAGSLPALQGGSGTAHWLLTSLAHCWYNYPKKTMGFPRNEAGADVLPPTTK